MVCGEDVEEITDSVLYLRYVLGEVDWNDLDRSPEKHIRCDPILAQFIVSDSFEPVIGRGDVLENRPRPRIRPERGGSGHERFPQAARGRGGWLLDCGLSFTRKLRRGRVEALRSMNRELSTRRQAGLGQRPIP